MRPSPMKQAEKLKIYVMCYWRLDRGCPIVALEHNWRQSDVIAVTRSGEVIETEVKITLYDLKRDRDKPKHHFMAKDFPPLSAHNFYFALPAELGEKGLEIIKEIYPYAGLLLVRQNHIETHYIDAPVSVARPAKKLNRDRLTQDEMLDLIAGVSTTACKMAYELMRREISDGPSNSPAASRGGGDGAPPL